MRSQSIIPVLLLLLASMALAQTTPVLPGILLRRSPMVDMHYAISTKCAGAQVNWLSGQIEAVGIGYGTSSSEDAKAQARATAIIVMVHQARRLFPMLSIDADYTMGDAVNLLGAQVGMESIFTGIVTVDEIWDKETRRFIMVGVLPLYGMNGVTELARNAVLPEYPAVPSSSDMMILRPIPRGHSPQRYNEPYSGIIIDADNVLINPCLYPRLLRFDGVELWGPGNADLVSQFAGPVRYMRNVNEAVNSGLAGDHPVILQAIGTGYGRYPVLNLDDSFLLLRMDMLYGLLSRLPILITVGQSPEAPLPSSWPAVFAANETATGGE